MPFFKKKQSSSFTKKELASMRRLKSDQEKRSHHTQQSSNRPPDSNGRFAFGHYTEAVDTIRDLARQNMDDDLEELLMWCILQTEAESQRDSAGVAPFYYEKMAILYHKQKKIESEIGVWERFAGQKHAPGVKPKRLLERLNNLIEREASLVSETSDPESLDEKLEWQKCMSILPVEIAEMFETVSISKPLSEIDRREKDHIWERFGAARNRSAQLGDMEAAYHVGILQSEFLRLERGDERAGKMRKVLEDERDRFKKY